MSTEIKTNLFSFKTFRSPDKVSADIKDKYFIYHPDIEESLVYGQNISSVREYDLFIESLEPVTDYHEIKNTDVPVYNFSCSLMQQMKNYSLRSKTLNNIFDLPRPMTDDKYLEIWEELLVQLLTQTSPLVQQMCLQMIIGQYCLLHNSSLTYDDVTKIVVVIPEILVKDFFPWKYDGCGGKLYGVYSLGIQDYRRVEQTLVGYVPGEVSHIENVMASEYKEKTSRNFLRTEEETEFLSETSIENLNDTTTTDRNEISSEIAKLIEKDKSFNISGSVSVSKDIMMLGNITANTSTGYTSNNSSSQSNTEAKNYAKEKVEQARERIEQKVSERRTYKMIKEFEETSKHGYDNRGGTQHVTGVYRWIDKIYRNQLVNYGKRLLLEVDVPHPSMIYKKSLRWKTEKTAAEQNLLTPPKQLDEFGIKSPSGITNNNAIEAAAYYGVVVQPYESEEQYITVDIPQTDVSNESFTESSIHDSVQIPQGLVADRIDGHGLFNYNTPTGKAYIEFDFGGGCKKYVGEYSDRGTKNFDFHFNLTNKIAGSVPFIVRYRRTNYYSATYIIKCVTDPALLADWQEETYATLLAAYQTKWDEYNEAMKLQQAQQNTDSEESVYSNASMNRLIEERELKRCCIEMLGKPYCHKQGKCFYASNTCDCSDPNSQQNCCSNCNNQENTCYDCECGTNGVNMPPVINQNQQLEDYVQYVKFFETAFQWEIMSYEFYPYYYNPQCKWYEIMQTKYENDPIFEAFLQSGMAKVLVPVRPQFEKAVLLYLDTGLIVSENLAAETEDEHNFALLGELINQDEEVVEETWETRIPSTLTIIQAKSTYLEDENGLPCAEGETSEFGSDDTTLQGLDNQNNQTENPEDEGSLNTRP